MGRLALRVTPGAKKNALEFGPPLRVRLTAPPIDGRANAALEGYLEGLSGMSVRVVSGRKSRIKTIAFESSEDAFLAALLNSQAGKK